MTMAAHPSAPPPAAAPTAAPPDSRQRQIGQVLERIALQRTRLRARRAARTQALVLAGHAGGAGGDPLVLRVACFVREHPWAVAALVAGAMVAGPRRILRWTGIVLPLLMRLKALAPGR